MKLWDYFKRKNGKSQPISEPSSMTEPRPGAFEFLISGDVDLPLSQFKDIAVPSSLGAVAVEREGSTYYKVGQNEFSYSVEEPGIQMTFDSMVSFAEALAIAEKVLQSFRGSGRDVELVILDNTKVYRSS